MPDDTPEEPTETPEPSPAAPGKESWWLAFTKKQIAVIAAVVGLALTATFSSGLQDLFSGLLPNGWTEPGRGIEVVDVLRRPMSGPVLIPNTEAASGFSDFGDARAAVNDPTWEADHEWYAVGEVTWEVTLIGRHRDDVVITDLRPVRPKGCTSTLRHGALVVDVPQGEGSKIELETALDAPDPELTSVEDGAAYFDDGTVTLSKGETVVISIRATSAGPTCQWVLEADYVDHGKRGSMTIKAPGDRPFAITGPVAGHSFDSTWSGTCNGQRGCS